MHGGSGGPDNRSCGLAAGSRRPAVPPNVPSLLVCAQLLPYRPGLTLARPSAILLVRYLTFFRERRQHWTIRCLAYRTPHRGNGPKAGSPVCPIGFTEI